MINSNFISDLHPALQRGAKEIMTRLNEKGIFSKITSTLRDNESQSQLYEQGRTTPGNIVTNAKAGESFHNYGLAFDIAPYDPVTKNIDWSALNPSWKIIGTLWETMGGTWGGNFSLADLGHMEYSGQLTISKLKIGERLPLSAYMPWEIVTEAKRNILNVHIGNKVGQISSLISGDFNFIHLRDILDFLGFFIADYNENEIFVESKI